MDSIVTMMTHGHSVVLERVGAPNAKGKKSVLDVFAGDAGDIVDLRTGHASAACLRIGWAARFVVFDDGSENRPKSGAFWCHLAVPTPHNFVSDVSGNCLTRFKPRAITGDWESTNPTRLFIGAVHVWDGGVRRIHRDDSVPRRNQQYSKPINNAGFVTQGLGVSLRVQAVDAKDDWLELRSVIIAFTGSELGGVQAPADKAAEYLVSERPSAHVG